MNAEKNQLLKQFKYRLIQNFGNDIQDVILFGSQITDEVHEDSDYDILIVLNRDYDSNYKYKILDVVYEFELNHDIFIDFKIISIQELKDSIRGKQPIFQDAIEKGMHL
jgi:predicted nucleotidyltransferase